jgi:hypothetical protein
MDNTKSPTGNEDDVLLSTFLSDCEKTESITNHLYVGWTPREAWREGEYNGFDFKAARFACSDMEGSQVWVERICEASACFDGLRHIWWYPVENADWKGYGNYPSLNEYAQIIEKLRELIAGYCNEDFAKP